MKLIEKLVTVMYFELLTEKKYNHKEIEQIIQIYIQLLKHSYHDNNTTPDYLKRLSGTSKK